MSLAAAHERLGALAKPPGALGELEDWAATLCEVQRTLEPQAEPASVLVFCADHGCKKADSALSPYPPAVTLSIFRALAAGISACAVLARSAGAALVVVDVGCDGDLADVAGAAPHITVRHSKVARGTQDFRQQPAMDEEALAAALSAGQETLTAEAARGVRVICVGEVGIGNTTSAAALLAALTGADPAECCGRGTGLDDGGLAHKTAVVREALDLHSHAHVPKGDHAPDQMQQQAREALRCLGGLEIAAMVGAYMQAEREGVVVVVDGSISAVAALCASRMHPPCRRNMVFASALAEEPLAARGGEILEESLAAKPALQMRLRLGEGSAAALALPMLRAAAAIVRDMGTLDQALALG